MLKNTLFYNNCPKTLKLNKLFAFIESSFILLCIVKSYLIQINCCTFRRIVNYLSIYLYFDDIKVKASDF